MGGKPLINAKHIQGAVAGFLAVALLFAVSAMLPGARGGGLGFDGDGNILFYQHPCYVGRGLSLTADTLSEPSGGWNAALKDEYLLIENIYQPDARRIAPRGDAAKPAPFTTLYTGRTAAEVLSAVDVGVKFTDGRAAPLFFNGFAETPALPPHALFGYTTSRSDYYGLGLADAYHRPADTKKIMRPEARDAINDAGMPPDALFDRFGTHIITSFTLGGRFDAYYVYHGAAEIPENAFQAAVSAAFTYITATGEVVLRGEDARVLADTAITLAFSGGDESLSGAASLNDARARYAAWYDEESLNKDTCGVSKLDRLVPIWELANSDARQAELRDAYLTMLDGYTQEIGGGHTPQETYISELVLFTGNNEITVKRNLRSRGYKVLDVNLGQARTLLDHVLQFENQGLVHAYSLRPQNGSLPSRSAASVMRANHLGVIVGDRSIGLRFKECIYLGYKTTTDPAQAITDILGATGAEPGGTNVFGGIEYITLDKNCNEFYTPSTYNFVPEDQYGSFMYNYEMISVITLHYTKDPAAGAPIRELSAASRYKSLHYQNVPRTSAPFSTPEMSAEYGWSLVCNADTGEMQDFHGGIPLSLQVYYDAGVIKDGFNDASNLSRYVTVWVRR